MDRGGSVRRHGESHFIGHKYHRKMDNGQPETRLGTCSADEKCCTRPREQIVVARMHTKQCFEVLSPRGGYVGVDSYVSDRRQ